MNQPTFATLAYGAKRKTTRRERFLREMDEAIPWGALVSVIEPYYPKGGNGRPPMGLGKMLRIHFMQQWFNLSDPGMEDALYDSEAMRQFSGIELGVDEVPDETTILKFRHLLEKHNLSEKLFEKVTGYLSEKGLLVREGTIVDPTIIAAPSSTKNGKRERDPEMSGTKKGRDWHFGMKVHVGADSRRGLIHSLVVTTAKVHDSQVMAELLHGGEEGVYGDKAYANEGKRQIYEENGIRWKIARKASVGRRLSDEDNEWNREQSRVRAFGEFGFRIMKRLWGHTKVRYRGPRKNAGQFMTLAALGNVYMVRKELIQT